MEVRERIEEGSLTGRQDVEAGTRVGFASSMRTIMPLRMAGFDFLSFWADEALLPSYSRVAACFGEGWISGRGQSMIVVGGVSRLSGVIYGAVSSTTLRILEGDVGLMGLVRAIGWTNGGLGVRGRRG